MPASNNREFAFILNDVARMLRTYADHKAAQFGMTRAQWAVPVQLDRAEGLNQSELAEILDLQPITLTRLLDKLCDSGLIERRPGPGRPSRETPVPDSRGPARAQAACFARRGDHGGRARRRGAGKCRMDGFTACHCKRKSPPADRAPKRGGRAALWLKLHARRQCRSATRRRNLRVLNRSGWSRRGKSAQRHERPRPTKFARFDDATGSAGRCLRYCRSR
jgi:hypothetical protein